MRKYHKFNIKVKTTLLQDLKRKLIITSYSFGCFSFSLASLESLNDFLRNSGIKDSGKE
jgi:hypothetical protein